MLLLSSLMTKALTKSNICELCRPLGAHTAYSGPDAHSRLNLLEYSLIALKLKEREKRAAARERHKTRVRFWYRCIFGSVQSVVFVISTLRLAGAARCIYIYIYFEVYNIYIYIRSGIDCAVGNLIDI